MKEQKKIFLQVKLPEEIVSWIDFSAAEKVLKRGPTCRMILLEALASVHETELKQLQFVFSHKLNAGSIVVAFEIPEQINRKLLELCNYFPVSKKKLAEILICQRVEKERKREV